jgi:hypothetical protein
MAGIAAYPQKAVLEAATLYIGLKFPMYIGRQAFASMRISVFPLANTVKKTPGNWPFAPGKGQCSGWRGFSGRRGGALLKPGVL